MADTFVDDIESIALVTAEWAKGYIKDIVETLAPNGRPFGRELKSTDEQLDEYRLIRNDVAAWSMWIQTRSEQITNMLMGSGVAPEQLSVINPLRIAASFALDYSIRMERLLNERMVT
jgi:hypothetical protein